MDTTGIFPILQDGDTVYSVKTYSEMAGNSLNGGKAPYRPDQVKKTYANYTSTAAQGTPVMWDGSGEVNFVAKKHGAVWIDMNALLQVPTANYNVSVFTELRSGPAGSGSQVHISSSGLGQSLLGYGTFLQKCTARYIVTGLTAGTTYYARLLYVCDAANSKITYGNLTIDY